MHRHGMEGKWLHACLVMLETSPTFMPVCMQIRKQHAQLPAFLLQSMRMLAAMQEAAPLQPAAALVQSLGPASLQPQPAAAAHGRGAAARRRHARARTKGLRVCSTARCKCRTSPTLMDPYACACDEECCVL